MALNRILDVARGEYVCLQDGDDIADPERLATQVGALDTDPELGAVFCRYALLVAGRRTAPRYRGADADECARAIARGANPAHDPTIMFRREETSHIRFDPELLVGQGVDHVLRIGEEFPVKIVDGCHYGYLVHEGNQSKGKAGQISHYYGIVRNKAAARRWEELAPPTRAADAWRPEPTATVTSDVVASTVELASLGRRREAAASAERHLRGIWRYPNSWLPLVYSVTPAALLKRKRPEHPVMFEDPRRSVSE